MRRIYTVFLYLLVPFILLRLYWKGRRLPAYRQRIAERFACARAPVVVDVWIHAVSLGEVVAATPLIDALLAKQWRVLITTMTPTGSEQVTRRFAGLVAHQYLPYDLPWALRRFFKKMNARLGIIMETELWPNVIYEGVAARVPLILANARVSDHAFKQYKTVDFFFKPILNQFTAILAQSALDGTRFVQLGASDGLVHTVGNIKFDVQTHGFNRDVCNALKQQWGSERPVIMAASTHEGEECQLLARLAQLQKAIPDVLLLIAPRHPERFHEVRTLSEQHGFRTGVRSQSLTITDDLEVIVIDSLGELLAFYAVSNHAFVGGSLVPIGGHNVLEAIAMFVPVYCGPYMNNSKTVCADLLEAGALTQVENADALITSLIDMHHNPELRSRQVENASAVLMANQGTLARHMEYVEMALKSAC